MKQQRITFNAMACACEVVLAAEDESAARALAAVAIEEVQRIEFKFSRYRDNSIVSRINAAAGGEAIACDDETRALFDHADALYRASGGLFDITSGVLRRAWNFKQPKLPTEPELAALRAFIGWERVQRDGPLLRLPEAGMEIDFGGFGKEYAADRAGALLASRGVQLGYVNLGGDMRVLGPKPDGQPWTMGIQDPRSPSRLAATLPVVRGGLATSGDYERFFELDGRRHCHILDPRTGWPVTYWRSVSVLAPLAVLAGNCSTIAMLKQADGLAFLDAAGVDYLAIDQQGAIHIRGGAADAAHSSDLLSETL